MRYPLLRCLARAIAKNGVHFLCGLVPAGGVLFDIAADLDPLLVGGSLEPR